jgi:hypothetical protein
VPSSKVSVPKLARIATPASASPVEASTTAPATPERLLSGGEVLSGNSAGEKTSTLFSNTVAVAATLS